MTARDAAPGLGTAPRSSGAARAARAAWDRLEEWALAALLAVMVLITFVTIVTRYVFDLPLSYIDQLVPNLFVWVTFLGASAAVKRRAHLGLSLVYDALPPRARAALDGVILAGTSAFFLATAWFGWQVVELQIQNRLTTSLGYPAWVVGLAVPAGSLLFVARSLEAWWGLRCARGAAPGSLPVA